MNKDFNLEEIHKLSTNNKEVLKNSKTCGCFYCLKTFSPDEIISWVDSQADTALCPHCGIDSVLGDKKVEITQDLLKKMHEKYF